MGSSEVGKCIRQVVYSKTGTPPDQIDPGVSGFTVRGNVMEDQWAAPLIRAWAKEWGGETLWSGQADQQTLIGKGVALSATPDGVCVNMARDCLAEYGVADIGESQCIVCELKSFDPRLTKLPKPAHVAQLQAQLGLVRAATNYKPDGGIIMYVNASDWFDIKVFPVAYDENAFRSLVKRADRALKTRNPDDVPPEGKVTGGCSECQFSKRCLGYTPYLADDDPRALSEKEVVTVEKLAKRAHTLAQKEQAAKEKRLSVEADLYLAMSKVKKRFVKGKHFAVVARKTASQNRNDAKKLIELAKRLGAKDADLELCKSPTREGTALSYEVVT